MIAVLAVVLYLALKLCLVGALYFTGIYLVALPAMLELPEALPEAAIGSSWVSKSQPDNLRVFIR